MRRLGSIAVFLAVFAVVQLAAQDESPHVYVVTYIKAKPDRAADYSRYCSEILGPLYDEFVKHEDMVSYHMLGQWPGLGPYSHVLIVEWVNWDAMHNGLTDLGSESWEAASQAAHGMTWAEATQDVDLAAMRDIIHREIYESVRPWGTYRGRRTERVRPEPQLPCCVSANRLDVLVICSSDCGYPNGRQQQADQCPRPGTELDAGVT